MEPKNSLFHEKATTNSLIPRGVPILQILKSVRVVEFGMKMSTQIKPQKDTKGNQKKNSNKNNEQQKITSKHDKDSQNNWIDKHRKKGNNRKNNKTGARSKNQESFELLEQENVINDKLGWLLDQENQRLAYFDTLNEDERWGIKGLEEKCNKEKEIFLCKQFETRPFSIKVSRLDLYKCKFCKLRYKSPVSRRLHERTHLKKDFTCKKCGKEFALKQYKDQHENKHVTLKRFRCLLCGKRYSYASGLSQHMQKSHKNLPNRRLRLKLERKSEQLTVVTADKTAPFQCGDCGKTFKRGIAFANHKRSHNHTKKFKCSYCQQQFKLEYNFNQHINTFHKGSTKDADNSSSNSRKK